MIFRFVVIFHMSSFFEVFFYFYNQFLCFRKIQGSKNLMPKRGISRFSIDILLSHSTEKFRRGTLLCCVSQNLRQRKSFGKEGGVSRASVESFSSHIAEKFGRGTTLLCCVSQNLRQRKSLRIRGGGEVSRFFFEIFLSHSAEKFRRGNLFRPNTKILINICKQLKTRLLFKV